jgi:signal transduction histidine kinase
VIENLVDNAVKFTSEGDVAVEVDRISATVGFGGEVVANGCTATDDCLCFSVRDSGIGVSRNKQEMIFDPFSQADGSSSRSYEGIGLGLAISKQLVELMGGKIGIDSEANHGSRFWFTLPLRQAIR